MILVVWLDLHYKHRRCSRSLRGINQSSPSIQHFAQKGSCTYYVIADRGGGLSKWLQYYIGGGSSQMITILHRGGPPKWLQYYIGVVWQMITVYHESWVVTLGILFPKTWQKNIFFSVGKKSFLGGMSKWLQLYIGGVRPNDYSIT